MRDPSPHAPDFAIVAHGLEKTYRGDRKTPIEAYIPKPTPAPAPGDTVTTDAPAADSAGDAPAPAPASPAVP